MKITKEFVLEHADDVAHVLSLVGDVVGHRAGGFLKDSSTAIAIVEAGYRALTDALRPGGVEPGEIERRVAALRSELTANDAAADSELDKKFKE